MESVSRKISSRAYRIMFFAYRVHDSGGLATKKNNRFTQKNLCDYIMYDGVLYLMEMKSHKGPSIPKDKLSQLEGLLAIRKDGVGAWFALNYRDYDVTYMLSVCCHTRKKGECLFVL